MIEKMVNIKWIFALIFGLLVVACNEARTPTWEGPGPEFGALLHSGFMTFIAG
jgi:hypothetical protein